MSLSGRRNVDITKGSASQTTKQKLEHDCVRQNVTQHVHTNKHGHGHSHSVSSENRYSRRRNQHTTNASKDSNGPSLLRVVVVVTIMIMFLIPTFWLWQEAKKVEKRKQENMRQYVQLMSQLHRNKEENVEENSNSVDTLLGISAATSSEGRTQNIESIVQKKLELVHIQDGSSILSQIVAPSSWDAPFADGPNSRDVVWAVFFYKPYCGACRRIRPTVEALASTVEYWTYIRFAAVDCVKHQYFCTTLDANDTPIIHLFKYNKLAGKRDIRASWRGMLVSYAITNWLREQQTIFVDGYSRDIQSDRTVLSQQIQWPSEDHIARAIIEYKKERETSFNEKLGTQSERVGTRPKNPSDYLLDIKAAFHFGLVDHIFLHSKQERNVSLSGHRLQALLHWLDACAANFPSAKQRIHIANLRNKLGAKLSWTPRSYDALLASWGHDKRMGIDPLESWRNCQLHPNDPAVGGYSCGLWTLFHTLLANARPADAYKTLWAIVGWVEEFFGCRECAKHFASTWAAEGITPKHGNMQAETHSQMHAVLWLWQAHNSVRSRLHEDAELINDGITRGRNKWQFPNIWTDCQDCYTRGALREWQSFRESLKLEEDIPKDEDDFFLIEHEHFDPKETPFGYIFKETKPHFESMTVYAYLQELYCYGSDTLTCAQFYDPAETIGTGVGAHIVVDQNTFESLKLSLRTMTIGRLLLTNDEIREFELVLQAEDVHRRRMHDLTREILVNGAQKPSSLHNYCKLQTRAVHSDVRDKKKNLRYLPVTMSSAEGLDDKIVPPDIPVPPSSTVLKAAMETLTFRDWEKIAQKDNNGQLNLTKRRSAIDNLSPTVTSSSNEDLIGKHSKSSDTASQTLNDFQSQENKLANKHHKD